MCQVFGFVLLWIFPNLIYTLLFYPVFGMSYFGLISSCLSCPIFIVKDLSCLGLVTINKVQHYHIICACDCIGFFPIQGFVLEQIGNLHTFYDSNISTRNLPKQVQYCICWKEFSVVNTVLIYKGHSDYVAHAWRNIGRLRIKSSDLWLLSI